MTERVGLGKELGQRTGGVMVAEGAGIVTSLGSLLLVKQIAGPERMAAAKEDIAVNVVLPLLKRMDGSMGRFQQWRDRLSAGNAKQPDVTQDSAAEMVQKASEASGATTSKAVKKAANVFHKKEIPLEEKARKYADTLLDFAIMAPVGIVTRIVVQDRADRAFGAPQLPMKEYLYAKIPDMVANNVALVAMTTVAKAPSQALTNVVEKILSGVGVDQTSADSMAKYLVYAQGSNFIGNLANVGYVVAKSRKLQDAVSPAAQTR